jgi:hypothetical protein
MPWSAGSFTRTNGFFTGATVWQSDFNALVKIVFSRHDTHDQDMAQGVNACLNKNGQNSPTANINWGGFKITNLSYGASDKDSATFGQTITGVSIDATSKVLTLTRTQGDLDVDLTPITIAGDTSDFARKNLDNAFAGTNDFNGAVNFAGGSGQQSRWIYNGVAILNAYAESSQLWSAYDNSSIVPALRIDTAAQTLSVYGTTLWTSANLTPANYLTASGNSTITGAWSFSQSLQVGGLVIAGIGYSWAATVPGPNTLQLIGTGGNFLKLDADGTYGSKLESYNSTSGAQRYWHNANLVTSSTLPVTGNDQQIALVTAGADKGVWVYVAPSGWTKIAS